MEMKMIMIGIIGVLVAAILLSSMLPTALSALYKVPTADNEAYGYDVNGKAIATDLNATNDATSIVIWHLFPLFAAIGGIAVLSGYVYKEYLY